LEFSLRVRIEIAKDTVACLDNTIVVIEHKINVTQMQVNVLLKDLVLSIYLFCYSLLKGVQLSLALRELKKSCVFFIITTDALSVC
jgi:hypothetical protein